MQDASTPKDLEKFLNETEEKNGKSEKLVVSLPKNYTPPNVKYKEQLDVVKKLIGALNKNYSMEEKINSLYEFYANFMASVETAQMEYDERLERLEKENENLRSQLEILLKQSPKKLAEDSQEGARQQINQQMPIKPMSQIISKPTINYSQNTVNSPIKTITIHNDIKMPVKPITAQSEKQFVKVSIQPDNISISKPPINRPPTAPPENIKLPVKPVNVQPNNIAIIKPPLNMPLNVPGVEKKENNPVTTPVLNKNLPTNLIELKDELLLELKKLKEIMKSGK
ncbi:Uncharacterised protein [Candidatus Tiddalikarchaeum anstoanum]|nr:Uncharacterised protein [Candidatus Tiddalikarchaeum anstoanum]